MSPITKNTDPGTRAKIETEIEYRNIRFRIVGAKPGQMKAMRGTGGCVRKVWNVLLERLNEELKDELSPDYDGDMPKSLSEYSLKGRVDRLKHEFDLEFLGECSSVALRGAAKALSLSFAKWFDNRDKLSDEDKERGKYKPNFKDKRGDDWFRYEGMKIKCHGGYLQLPKICTRKTPVCLQRKGGNPYDGLPVKAVTVSQQNERWYATVCYKVTVPKVYDDELTTCVGIDVGVSKQVALSNGEYAVSPDISKLEAKCKRHQRRADRQKGGNRWKKRHGFKYTDKVPSSNRRKKRLRTVAKISRQIANIRKYHAHGLTRHLADGADVVVTEDLSIVNMTKRAKGKNVKAKSGLNKSILHNCWGDVRRKLDYKAKRHISVDPKYTSQGCSVCGHIEEGNRRSQSAFVCKACGHKENADVNAAKNVLGRGMKEHLKAIEKSRASVVGVPASVVGAKGRRGEIGHQDYSYDPSTVNLVSSITSKTGLKPVTHSILRR